MDAKKSFNRQCCGMYPSRYFTMKINTQKTFKNIKYFFDRNSVILLLKIFFADKIFFLKFSAFSNFFFLNFRYVFHANQKRQCCKTVVYDTDRSRVKFFYNFSVKNNFRTRIIVKNNYINPTGRHSCCADALTGPNEQCDEHLYINS